MTGSTWARDRATERRVHDLSYPEQLVLWSIRQWLEGPEGRRLVQQEFLHVFRLHQVELALAGLDGLVTGLNAASRRVLYLRRSNCCLISRDEESLLCLLAAAQSENRDHVIALTSWLVPLHSAPRLTEHARDLVLALHRRSLELPLQRPARPVRCAPSLVAAGCA